MAQLFAQFVWNAKVTRDGQGKPLLTGDDLKLVHKAALAQCVAGDGLKDGVISDPLHCTFNPGQLSCKAGRAGDCLSPEKISAVKSIYGGPETSAGVRLSTGGPLPGSESEHWEWAGGTWLPLTAADETAQQNIGVRYIASSSEVKLLQWKPRDFDFDRDYQRLSGSLYDASNPDLRKFKEAGGKLIVYEGLNDPLVPPQRVIDYYETVERTMGGRAATQSFFRLYALAGMDHCSFGDGAFAVNWLGALESWVEQGQTPERLVASHVNVDDLSYDKPADTKRFVKRMGVSAGSCSG